MNLINRMESVEYNALAKRLARIIEFRSKAAYFLKTYKDDGDPKYLKDQERIVKNCTKKTNAFNDYVKGKGCNWEEFEKEYYGGDDVEEKKKEVTKPKKE